MKKNLHANASRMRESADSFALVSMNRFLEPPKQLYPTNFGAQPMLEAPYRFHHIVDKSIAIPRYGNATIPSPGRLLQFSVLAVRAHTSKGHPPKSQGLHA